MLFRSIERGLPNIQKDRDSAKHILGAMRTVAARDALARQLEMQAIRNGRPPDLDLIKAAVDQTIPSYVERIFAGGAAAAAPQQQQPRALTVPDNWKIEIERAPAKQQPQESSVDPNSPAGRAQARRAQTQQQSQSREAEARASINAEFNHDLQNMDSLSFARKYDNARRLLTPDQIRMLEQQITDAMRRDR